MNTVILHVIYSCIIITAITVSLIMTNNLSEAWINAGISGVGSILICGIFHFWYVSKNKLNNISDIIK
tara:strand:+ start:1071 stop:1274 length:204 start_codon:yes stop_codon:yes gene_type:complete